MQIYFRGCKSQLKLKVRQHLDAKTTSKNKIVLLNENLLARKYHYFRECEHKVKLKLKWVGDKNTPRNLILEALLP